MRYEAVRQQVIGSPLTDECGWQYALVVRRGILAWMRAWPIAERTQSPRDDTTGADCVSPVAPISIPSSVCEQVASVLASMIMAHRRSALSSPSPIARSQVR